MRDRTIRAAGSLSERAKEPVKCRKEQSNARLQDCDAALVSDDGPIFSTVAKLVEALKRSVPEGTQNAELRQEALRLGRELLRGTKHEEE